jgi:hypothetical protein
MTHSGQRCQRGANTRDQTIKHFTLDGQPCHYTWYGLGVRDINIRLRRIQCGMQSGNSDELASYSTRIVTGLETQIMQTTHPTIDRRKN